MSRNVWKTVSCLHQFPNQGDGTMKLLANENFPLKSIQYLRNKGFDVLAIGVDYAGTSDLSILGIAQDQGRIILTFDRDYGELIFKHRNRLKYGVIYLRFEKFSPLDPGKMIEELFQRKNLEFEFTMTVLDENGIRQRKYWPAPVQTVSSN